MIIFQKALFTLLKNLYLLFGQARYYRFISHIKDYKDAQMNVLKSIHKNKDHLADEDLLLFHRSKKIMTYDQLGEAYFKAKKNTAHPFTGDEIKVIEPTSGSSGSKKRILYTSELLRIFQKMFLIWSIDILLNFKNLKTGLTYISISPRFSKDEDEGLETDKDYLSSLSSLILTPFLLCPSKVGKIKDGDEFFLVTTLYFICAKHLEIISVWSPSFLGSIIKCLTNNHEEIQNILDDGFYKTSCQQSFQFRINDQEKMESFQNKKYFEIFSSVKLISCWMVASGKTDLYFLKDYFPNAIFQPKGLLATEAPLTIPLFKESHQIPLYDEVFYEFEDESGSIKYLWQLEQDKIYEIIFSHSGGLVRYRLNDLVKVKGFYQGIPTLEFLSRSGAITDLVGEKLTENYLMEVDSSLSRSFDWIMIPQRELTHEKGYTLFYESNTEEKDVEFLKKKIEGSYHFHHALILKQLRSTNLYPVENLKNKISLYYEKEGIKRGDQKNQYLVYRPQDADLADFLKT